MKPGSGCPNLAILPRPTQARNSGRAEKMAASLLSVEEMPDGMSNHSPGALPPHSKQTLPRPALQTVAEEAPGESL